MAEIELSIAQRLCLHRCIGEIALLREELAA